jgi:CRP-like cAMP-binding protein
VPPIYIVQKLEQFTLLSAADKHALEKAVGQKVRHVAPREDIIREGDKPDRVNILLEGFACRYKTLEDGRRQIVSFFIPGDICDVRLFLLKQMDHSIATLAPAKIAEITAEAFIALTDASPRLTRAMWWNSLVEEAIAREWVRNIGQRTAYERLAHLFCELFLRMRAVGLANDHTCEMPMTQTELADATGLSAVHVNRTLQDLRGDGLISLRGRTLVIPDLEALQTTALFNANYLHFDRSGQPYDANDG